MKITSELIQKVKTVPIEQFLPNKFKQSGNNKLFYICPFHHEKTPSFVVYLNTNTYHCFSCSANGDVISFIMDLTDVSFAEAVRYLEKYI